MRPIRAATILTILGLGLAACGGHEQTRAKGHEAGPAKDVKTAEVVRDGGVGEVAVPAAVQARKRAALSARMPASVTELPYQEGQWVEAGAVVVRLDDAALRAAVAAAEAGLKAVASDLERTKALLEKGAATPRELEQMTAAASAARAQLESARDNLSHAALRAPFAGRVASRRVNLGDVVTPGMPLLEIEGQGGLELRATVESEIAATLRPGSKVRAMVDGQSGPLAATVTAIAPSGDETTHRFEVKADLPAATGLRAGLFARVLVPGIAADPRLTVPAAALFDRGGLTGLFVVSDARARLRWVAVGVRDGDSVEIRAGVEAGEHVALDPKGLVDGTSGPGCNAAASEADARRSGGERASGKRGDARRIRGQDRARLPRQQAHAAHDRGRARPRGARARRFPPRSPRQHGPAARHLQGWLAHRALDAERHRAVTASVPVPQPDVTASVPVPHTGAPAPAHFCAAPVALPCLSPRGFRAAAPAFWCRTPGRSRRRTSARLSLRAGACPRGYRAGTPRRSACTIANTAPTTRIAPATSSTASDSPSTSAPSAIATTGLTVAGA